jgi:hypothetical protein
MVLAADLPFLEPLGENAFVYLVKELFDGTFSRLCPQ